MSKYQIWMVECARCGWDEHAGEDEGSIPAACPKCGHAGDWWDDDAWEDEATSEPPS